MVWAESAFYMGFFEHLNGNGIKFFLIIWNWKVEEEKDKRRGRKKKEHGIFMGNAIKDGEKNNPETRYILQRKYFFSYFSFPLFVITRK